MHEEHELDRIIGTRLRTARLFKGMSQSALGERLAVTFKQIQKYERGTNRLAASRLATAAAVLDQPITYLYAQPADMTPPLAQSRRAVHILALMEQLEKHQPTVFMAVYTLLCLLPTHTQEASEQGERSSPCPL